MKSTLLKQALLFTLLTFSSFALFAQDMEVTDGATAPYTPENLITNVFLGDGVEVTSFQYDGSAESIGFFKSAEDEIGIDRGIIMTTGRASANAMHPGATGTGNQFAGASVTPNIMVDADLTQLDPNNPNNDISRYTISFIPTSDTVRFNYVFASEEYPEFGCFAFNDVFGFFISGPGINGPFSNNAENIALIPGTSEFVSINNLHPIGGGCTEAANEEFYNDNNNSGNQPVYDGFSDVFTAEAIVIPCEEYTIKLVIADKGDTALDSGVFLQAKSFGSPALDVDVVTASLDGAVVEGCAEGVIVIALPSPVETDMPLDYEIFGDAENGVDFELIPGGLFIPAGESSISIPLIAFEDGIDEGEETFAIAFQVNFCDRDTFYLSIKDNVLISPEIGVDLVQCASDVTTLDGTVNIPLPPVPSFTNDTDFYIDNDAGLVMSPIQVTGVQPLILGPGVIRSVCINIDYNWLDDVDVFLQSPGGQFIELTTDNGLNGDDYIETCFTEDAALVLNYNLPSSPFSPPFTGDWLPEGVWGDLYDSEYPTNGEWNLLVAVDAAGFNGDILDWTIEFEPSYDIFYEWTPSEGLSCDDCPMPEASPNSDVMYNLRAYDTYGCEVFDSVFIEVIPALVAPNVVCSGVTLECLTFSWDDNGATGGYEVNIDGTGWIPANGADGLSHEICGLGAEQTVIIEVQGIGTECDSFIGTGECTTPECEVPTVVMQNESNVSCAGGNDGTLDIEMIGNFPPFTYTIDGQTQANTIIANFTGLTAALHDLLVVDASGCELTLQILIEEPQGMSLEDVLIQDIQCNGADDGSAAVIVTNAQFPLMFEWSSGETDSVAVNLEPGPALVTVTDVEGCEIVGSIFIAEPEGMTVDLATTSIICNGQNDGAITSTVVGGEGMYSYQWSDADGQTTADAVDLLAGDYTLVVTDENMCTVTESITIDQNPPITTNVSSTQATCSGTGDGSATASGSGGGVNFFVFQWDSNAADQTDATATGLDVGQYFVTITDLLGCANVDSIEITAPNAMDVSSVQSTTSCFDTTDGEASISVLGGTMPYIYTWSDGGLETPDRTDLAAGMQTMTVTDDNGCFVEVELDIPSPDEISLNIIENNAADCNGAATGSLICGGTGGTGDFANFTFLWSTGEITATASNLPAGNYCITVSDEAGCSAIICEDITEPDALAVTEVIENVSCFTGNDGTITVTVTGGTEPYEYLWDDPNAQTTASATDLTATAANVLITDANGCTISASYVVDEPTLLTASTDFTALSCDGTPDGTSTVTGLGGTEPYTYAWEDGQTSQTATSLDATTYQVTVIDAEGCEATAEVTLTEPVQVVIDDVTQGNVTCFGGNDGQATVVYSGGTAPFDITWSNTETGETVTELTAGTYTVNIIDQSGCNASESITIEQPQDLNITLAQTSSFCHNGTDGTASVTALSYGNVPADLTTFTYEWSSTPNQNTAAATNLTGGQTYEVLITDAVGCQWTESITIDNPAEIGAIIENTRDVSCFAGVDGSATVAGAGGTSPYTYLWAANAGSQTTATAGDLTTGNYSVTILDANGCATALEVRIEEPEALNLAFTAEDASCFGVADGKASATPIGGTEPYVLAWSDDLNGTTQADLPAAMYTVSLVDANNCEYIDSVRVNQPEAVSTEANPTGVTCYGYRDGYIDLESEGGTAPYTYSVDGENFFGSTRLIALEPGSYDVIIRDGNGCTFDIYGVEIDEPEEFIIDLGEDIRIEYGDHPQLIPSVSGNAGGTTYDWNPIGPFELLDDCYDCSTVLVDTFSGQAAFELTMVDTAGCTATDLITIFIDKEVNVLVPTGFSPNGAGDGRNEFLHVHGDSKIEVKVFRIYDRWGELLYEVGDFMINDESVGWDGNFRGEEMPAGVYVWYMEVEAEDGEPATFKGNTTLLR